PADVVGTGEGGQQLARGSRDRERALAEALRVVAAERLARQHPYDQLARGAGLSGDVAHARRDDRIAERKAPRLGDRQTILDLAARLDEPVLRCRIERAGGVRDPSARRAGAVTHPAAEIVDGGLGRRPPGKTRRTGA